MLMDAFIASKGEPIEFGGRTIHWTYYVPVEQGDVVRFSFQAFAASPVQGLSIDCDACTGRIFNSVADKFSVWSDTAPPFFDLQVVEAKRDSRFAIFNVWSDHTHSPMIYRQNDAGIYVVEEAPGRARLNCSDGYGPADFSDLVVIVERNPS
jgi:hypothetical protein